MGDNRRLDRRLLWGITLAGLLLVLYFRLIPFDISFTGGLSDVFARFTWQPLSIKDIPINLVMFIPFSFGVAGLLYQSGRSWRSVSWTTVLLVLAISTAIEVLQVYIPERVPSLTDIAMNGLSAVLGALLYRLTVFGFHRAIVRYATPSAVMAGLVIYAGLVALLTAYLLWTVELGNWDDGFPLTLGNETVDSRPWEGEIYQVVLLSRAVSVEEAAELLAGKPPADALAQYVLAGPAPFQDQRDTLPPLEWLPDPPLSTNDTSAAVVGAGQWLSTISGITPFNEQTRQESRFTVAIDFAATDAPQLGPARIFSVSADSKQRNLTLGQQRRDLVIRLRTPSSGANGEKPVVSIPRFFVPLEPHHVVLTYDSPQLTAYVDGAADPYALSLGPGVAFFQDFERGDGWLLHFPENPHLFDYRYWALFTIPALLFAAILIGIHDAANDPGTVPDTIEPRDLST